MKQLWTKIWLYPIPELSRYNEADDINVGSLHRALPRASHNVSNQTQEVFLETTNPKIAKKLEGRTEARLIYNGNDKLWRYTLPIQISSDLDKYLEELTNKEVYLDTLTEGATTLYYGKKLKWQQ